jgi:methyl-accepting chemotaxis protein
MGMRFTDHEVVLLQALKSLEAGDFSVRLDPNADGVYGEIADVFNRIALANDTMCNEIERVHLAIAVEGDFEQRVNLPAPAGAWGRCVDSANQLIDNMVQPMILVRDAIGAVADGDLSCALSLINNQPQVPPLPLPHDTIVLLAKHASGEFMLSPCIFGVITHAFGIFLYSCRESTSTPRNP